MLNILIALKMSLLLGPIHGQGWEIYIYTNHEYMHNYIYSSIYLSCVLKNRKKHELILIPLTQIQHHWVHPSILFVSLQLLL